MTELAAALLEVLPPDQAIAVLCAIIAFCVLLTSLALAVVVIGLLWLVELRRGDLEAAPPGFDFGETPNVPQYVQRDLSRDPEVAARCKTESLDNVKSSLALSGDRAAAVWPDVRHAAARPAILGPKSAGRA